MDQSAFENIVEKGGKCFSHNVFYPITEKNHSGHLKRKFVYKIQVNPNHTILKYGIYYDFMDR